jgi:uncharacterized protein YdaU (DUF1376 family)
VSKEDKPDAWMPLYIGDWDGDTRHLDCEQDGAYGRLVRHYWRNGPLADDDTLLARIVGMPNARWRKLRPTIASFFVVADVRWTHKRVDAELIKWAARKAKAVARAQAAAEARWHGDEPQDPKPKRRKRDATSIPQALLDECPSSSSRKVRGKIDSPLTLSERDGDGLRPVGPPPPRAAVIQFDIAREELGEAERQRRMAERKAEADAVLAQLPGRRRKR